MLRVLHSLNAMQQNIMQFHVCSACCSAVSLAPADAWVRGSVWGERNGWWESHTHSARQSNQWQRRLADFVACKCKSKCDAYSQSSSTCIKVLTVNGQHMCFSNARFSGLACVRFVDDLTLSGPMRFCFIYHAESVRALCVCVLRIVVLAKHCTYHQFVRSLEASYQISASRRRRRHSSYRVITANTWCVCVCIANTLLGRCALSPICLAILSACMQTLLDESLSMCRSFLSLRSAGIMCDVRRVYVCREHFYRKLRNKKGLLVDNKIGCGFINISSDQNTLLYIHVSFCLVWFVTAEYEYKSKSETASPSDSFNKSKPMNE